MTPRSSPAPAVTQRNTTAAGAAPTPLRRAIEPDQVGAWVFQGARVPRFLRLSADLPQRVGAWVLILTVSVLLSSALAIRYYRMMRAGQPARVSELESELEAAQSELKQAQERARQATRAATERVSETSATATGQTTSASTLPAGSAPSTPIDTSASPASATPPALGQTVFPGALALAALPSPEALKFRLERPRAQWSGSSVRVLGSLAYTANDGGSQQGRILVIVRGADALHVSPSGALNDARATSLIAPERGEYFSVSRFREIRVDLGPFRSRDAVSDAEILIFGSPSGVSTPSESSRLLMRTHLSIQDAAGGASRGTPKRDDTSNALTSPAAPTDPAAAAPGAAPPAAGATP